MNPKTSLPKMELRKLEPEKFPQKDITLRVVTGPQDTAFSEEEVRKFFWYSATITNEFDRMGCRLEREEPLHHIKDGNTISDGIVFGSIQVPTNGQPIIMLADAQADPERAGIQGTLCEGGHPAGTGAVPAPVKGAEKSGEISGTEKLTDTAAA